MTPSRPRTFRIVLIALLAVAVLVLAGVLIVLIPILTHQSAGGSGQNLPTEFVSEVSATGADGRTRTLEATTPDGTPAELDQVTPGESLVISGTGFDSGIGIYLAICAIPESPSEKPGPCLGGIPEGAESGDANATVGLASAWITDAWAWRAFATHGYDDPETGAFAAMLTVPDPVMDGLDCRETRCAIATRADHTAASDRVQDILLPVAFAE
ncbi:hypothetical protein [Leucobacter luti]|uniref:Uncharacterized protein n=1 Tax=Leucobacter luti TaxID=340320 RepID=A0A4V6MCY6_9MICO|nr:hypothetical protein [Leucobacter luti]MBL3698822.1 hypothetical protein [Leucobacter luti]RZT66199.1 hypothetical protein EV139_1628 [Leucobacter luti]